MVLSSTIAAFNEVCPTRYEAIHAHFRKLYFTPSLAHAYMYRCEMMMDFDEWGQIILLQFLTRYARTQFADPERAKERKEEADKKKAEKKEKGNRHLCAAEHCLITE